MNETVITFCALSFMSRAQLRADSHEMEGGRGFVLHCSF
jgi:hypothetical protein